MSDDDIHVGEALEKSPEQIREEYAEAFDQPTDPLAQYNNVFTGLPDPFDYFIYMVVTNRDRIDKPDTIEEYRRTFRQWREFMATTDRHPACPTKQQIKSFITWRRDVHNNAPSTIKLKLSRLNQAYEYWQDESVFPHPIEYNPIQIARKEVAFGENKEKPFPNLSLQSLRDIFSQIANIRSRTLIGSQLKLGIRAGELRNWMIRDIHISHAGVQKCYPNLGTHPALEDYTDVVVIPPDRDGNKSSVPRLLPIDEELRWLLIRHLMTRPQVDEPWVFLSTQSFTQLSTTRPVNRPWKEAFHPEYAETDDNRAVTSHFGRHWFSSYTRLEMGLNRELVQYMRGDLIEPEGENEWEDAIDDYLHPNYEHINDDYRNEIFKLNIPMKHYAL
ncbi:tyrosine-type recombinase/integrase [Natrinema amylolyticum]|uniref:tyrosine-type recombinase/integrase n=1 Tax=Natrinema amylolyticum TaxID=2878679 RepID=UPI001CFA97E5|nr:site-specific integrase [Natrinema amylolyticum]